MVITPIFIPFLYLLMVGSGVLFETVILSIYHHLSGKHLKEYHFKISQYLFFLFLPLVATLIIIFLHDLSLAGIFLIFTIIGTLLEWLVGFSYHHIVGQRLWTYHRLSIMGYTSLLSIPIWGMAGVLFWLLAKYLG